MRLVVFRAFLVASVVLSASLPAAAGDWPEGIRATPAFTTLENATLINWTVTNTGDTPLTLGGIRVHYTCGNAEVEVITHEYLSTILPGATTSDGNYFVCVEKDGVVSLSVETPEGGSTAAERLIYMMPCNRTLTKQMTLDWQQEGFYTFKTEDGTKGVVARATLDDETLIKAGCGELGSPEGGIIQQIRTWFRAHVFAKEGDPKKGYTTATGSR